MDEKERVSLAVSLLVSIKGHVAFLIRPVCDSVRRYSYQDLTPLDSLACGRLKSLVYDSRLRNIVVLHNSTLGTCVAVIPVTLVKLMATYSHAVYERHDGHQAEHLLEWLHTF